MAALDNKLVVLYLFLAVAHRVVGQDLQIGNRRPCQDPGFDPDPNNPEDNLSCPLLNPNLLQCYSEAQLCDGDEFCDGGSDEGDNVVALECGKLSTGRLKTLTGIMFGELLNIAV